MRHDGVQFSLGSDDSVVSEETMATKKDRILSRALDMLLSEPQGIRYSRLVRSIDEELPDVAVKTVERTIWELEGLLPEQVYKPARGLYRHTKFRDDELGVPEPVPPGPEWVEEQCFYGPFTEWLKSELEECTKAMPLGGNKFRDKWGTPDVIGIRESRRSDIVKFPTDIVSAEIKSNTRDLITAFGQACSYKLFSHKSYIVVPKTSAQDDIAKLDALCLIFGIGLILFDCNNIDEPQFEIRVRATRHEPDMFYVNKYMKIIEKELFS